MKVMAFYSQSVGKKVVMAASGLVLMLFLVVHLIANLLVFAGSAQLNAYADFLKESPVLAWSGRTVLALAVLVHVVAAFQIAWQNLLAVGDTYRKRRYLATSYAGRTMLLTGPLLAFYIVFHLAHLTFGQFGHFEPQDVYANVVFGFGHFWLAGLYSVSMLVLVWHLYHGTYSLGTSLGLNPSAWRRNLTRAFAILMGLGYLSVPVAVRVGLLFP
jgi:succinate dehydrogenase / fumarate reductase cytochrome b subunit